MLMPMSGNCCDLLVSIHSRNTQPEVWVFGPERPLGYGCSSAKHGLNQGPMAVLSGRDTYSCTMYGLLIAPANKCDQCAYHVIAEGRQGNVGSLLPLAAVYPWTL